MNNSKNEEELVGYEFFSPENKRIFIIDGDGKVARERYRNLVEQLEALVKQIEDKHRGI